mgnify:CR=1 FL=1
MISTIPERISNTITIFLMTFSLQTELLFIPRNTAASINGIRITTCLSTASVRIPVAAYKIIRIVFSTTNTTQIFALNSWLFFRHSAHISRQQCTYTIQTAKQTGNNSSQYQYNFGTAGLFVATFAAFHFPKQHFNANDNNCDAKNHFQQTQHLCVSTKRFPECCPPRPKRLVEARFSSSTISVLSRLK